MEMTVGRNAVSGEPVRWAPAELANPHVGLFGDTGMGKSHMLRRFARALRPYRSGILAHCRYPLGTNLIEGINNKIKVIKRMAYGFRDDQYFFLKIRAAFPGVG